MAVLAAGLFWAASAMAQSSETNFTFSVNQPIPDGNPNGMALATNLAGMSGTINNVTASLNISGGYNGDLYAYLVGPNGGFAVLLNRVGVSNSTSAFGYSDSGMNVTFSDSAANDIHYYQNVGGYSLTGTTWQPDGINIDPQSDPNAFSSAPQTAMLSSFDNDNPNGQWTLFLADLSSGGQATIVSWSLDIVTTVPEPSVCALIGLGGLCLAVAMHRSRDNRKNKLFRRWRSFE